MRNKDCTRYKSDQQEKRLASGLGGRQVVGSGSTPFLKGDVVTSNLFVEAKTKVKASKSISIKKEWLEKAQEQSYSMRKRDYALAISFGDGKDYYIIEDRFMEELYKSREALERIVKEIGGVEHHPLGLENIDIYMIKEILQEVLR